MALNTDWDFLAIILNWKIPGDGNHRWWSECLPGGGGKWGEWIKEEYFCFHLYLKSKHFEIKRKYFKFIHQNTLLKKENSEKIFGWYDLNPFKFQISTFHTVLWWENSKLRIACGLEKLFPAHLSWQTTMFLFCCWNFKNYRQWLDQSWSSSEWEILPGYIFVQQHVHGHGNVLKGEVSVITPVASSPWEGKQAINMPS